MFLFFSFRFMKTSASMLPSCLNSCKTFILLVSRELFQIGILACSHTVSILFI